MRVNLGALFALILSYLVSESRELYLSEHKLENLFHFTCLIYYLAETRKFSRQGEAFWNSSTAHERKAAPGKMSEFFLRDILKTILNEKFNPQMKTIRPFSPRKLGQLFLIFKKRLWRPLVVRLYWADENTKKQITLGFWIDNNYSSSKFTSFFPFALVIVCSQPLFN